MHLDSRQDKRSGLLVSLQLIRGLAALGIVLYHLTNEMFTRFNFKLLGGLFLTSYSGVDVFFVLSGFVLYYSFRQRQRTGSGIKAFLLKRLIRLYPIYWIITALIVGGLYAMKTHALSTFTFSPAFIINTILLLPHNPRLIPPAWTLTYELYFYMLFIPFFFLKEKKILGYSALMYSALIVITAFLVVPWLPILKVGHIASSYLQVAGGIYIIEFFMGIGGAHLLNNGAIFRKGKAVLCTGLMLFIVSSLANTYLRISGTALEELRFLYFGFPALFMIYGFAAVELQHPHLLPALFAVPGNISFTLYLSHYAVIQLLLSRLGSMTRGSSSAFMFFSIACMTFLTTLAIGALFHYFVENKLLRILRGKFTTA